MLGCGKTGFLQLRWESRSAKINNASTRESWWNLSTCHTSPRKTTGKEVCSPRGGMPSPSCGWRLSNSDKQRWFHTTGGWSQSAASCLSSPSFKFEIKQSTRLTGSPGKNEEVHRYYACWVFCDWRKTRQRSCWDNFNERHYLDFNRLDISGLWNSLPGAGEARHPCSLFLAGKCSNVLIVIINNLPFVAVKIHLLLV